MESRGGIKYNANVTEALKTLRKSKVLSREEILSSINIIRYSGDENALIEVMHRYPTYLAVYLDSLSMKMDDAPFLTKLLIQLKWDDNAPSLSELSEQEGLISKVAGILKSVIYHDQQAPRSVLWQGYGASQRIKWVGDLVRYRKDSYRISDEELEVINNILYIIDDKFFSENKMPHEDNLSNTNGAGSDYPRIRSPRGKNSLEEGGELPASVNSWFIVSFISAALFFLWLLLRRRA